MIALVPGALSDRPGFFRAAGFVGGAAPVYHARHALPDCPAVIRRLAMRSQDLIQLSEC
ncbi:hypothetical protein [Noviherbaspirillum aridicola]|uniref:hypothetical protein n=1 Tax=Noviherbaspirillum aridicola TaxID=2849687 RepID=UPI001C81A977|nr:hypothetical protein [Noviherbaspirillum aridicola]